eukprot:UN18002
MLFLSIQILDICPGLLYLHILVHTDLTVPKEFRFFCWWSISCGWACSSSDTILGFHCFSFFDFVIQVFTTNTHLCTRMIKTSAIWCFVTRQTYLCRYM